MRTGRRIALNTETDDCEKISAPLILDLMGPFGRAIPARQTEEDPGIAIICAPLCVDHYATSSPIATMFHWPGILAPAPKGEYHTAYVYRLRRTRRLGEPLDLGMKQLTQISCALKYAADHP